MIKFIDWVKLQENLWGNIPVKGKKPSDGPNGSGQMQAAPTGQPMQSQMNKKMKKK